MKVTPRMRVNPNHQNRNGVTLLMLTESPEEVEQLCQIPSLDPLVRDKKGRTARQRKRLERLKSIQQDLVAALKDYVKKFPYHINVILHLIDRLKDNEKREQKILGKIGKEQISLQKVITLYLKSSLFDEDENLLDRANLLQRTTLRQGQIRLSNRIEDIIEDIQRPSPIEQALLQQERAFRHRESTDEKTV